MDPVIAPKDKKLAPEIAPAAAIPEQVRPAILAWFEADTDEKKAATVKKFPELTEIYSLAQQFIK